MLEWQNESSLFTVRIQGKQWYWVYKYNSDTNYRLNSVYINVGNNNWMKYNSTPTEINFDHNDALMGFIFDYEFKLIHRLNLKKYSLMGSQLNPYSLFTNSGKLDDVEHSTNLNLKWLKNYRNFKFSRIKSTTIGAQKRYAHFHSYKTKKAKNVVFDTNTMKLKNFTQPVQPIMFSNSLLTKIKIADIVRETLDILDDNTTYNTLDVERHVKSYSRYNIKTQLNLSGNENLFDVYKTNYTRQFESDRLDEFSESSENLRIKASKFPIRLVRGVINKHNAQILRSNTVLNKNILFNYKVNKFDTTGKISQSEQFWGFRQKRYRKLRSFSFPQQPKYNSITYSYLNNFLQDKTPQTYQLYTAIKNNKYKNELIPVTLARRLLRTKRTLVLPAHINITLITNSYDVVHSWFVPGLGLKIDCVPGRSTHHTLYIDNVGFYYGQCAEICGRYHHHMPIRVCALPYEHFMLWWQTKGLPRMYRSKLFLENRTALLTKFKQ